MMIKNEQLGWRWWLNFPKLLIIEIIFHGYLLFVDPKMMLGSWPELFRLIPSAIRKRKMIKTLQRKMR
ncbi:hypothetical protein [Cohnella sp.]|uniref:hypothetical protein n=1 Tax=Cohnella sp. TaxID=1883426 RepID=UPI0035689CB6